MPSLFFFFDIVVVIITAFDTCLLVLVRVRVRVRLTSCLQKDDDIEVDEERALLESSGGFGYIKLSKSRKMTAQQEVLLRSSFFFSFDPSLVVTTCADRES
jgi:hypothetical protein